MIQQAVGYKFFPNKNLIDNEKRDTKNRISFIKSPITAQATGECSVTRKITVVKGKDINDIQYDGKNVLHSSAWWYDEDGTKHPAFCVDPKLAGPGEIAAGKYDVNVTVN